jgi:hypothetical protein
MEFDLHIPYKSSCSSAKAQGTLYLYHLKGISVPVSYSFITISVNTVKPQFKGPAF